MNLRSLLYRAARFLGDVQAVQRGPNAIAKRIARKATLRLAGRFTNRLFK